MNELSFLQDYWWLIISILGAALVFLLFVQGGQTMLLMPESDMERTLMINALGRKWELTYTTLVVFGGAFFASFPLFYSTSFGGAYWLWMIILFSFVLQAVSYEFRKKPGNLYGSTTYDVFLFINGCIGCVLLGVAVGMMFFGAEFTVTKVNILDNPSPVISRWVAGSHGLEAILNWRNLLLGFTVLFLSRTQSTLYFMSSIRAKNDKHFLAECKQSTLYNGAIFVIFFLIFMAVLLTSPGYETDNAGRVIGVEQYKYFNNYIELWWIGVTLIVGVLMTLYGIVRGALDKTWRKGIWWTGIGSSLVVLTLFWVAGYNNTSYYPSLVDAQSSLSIRNSSSTLFTLKVMAWVSILVPFVIGYIAYVWRSMNKTPITPEEMESPANNKY